MDIATRAIRVVNKPMSTGSCPLSVPIAQSSASAFKSADAMAGPDGRYVYTRRGNPAVRALEDTLADLEGGTSAPDRNALPEPTRESRAEADRRNTPAARSSTPSATSWTPDANGGLYLRMTTSHAGSAARWAKAPGRSRP